MKTKKLAKFILVVCLTLSLSGALSACDWGTDISDSVTQIVDSIEDAFTERNSENKGATSSGTQTEESEENIEPEEEEPATPVCNIGIIADANVFPSSALNAVANQFFADEMYRSAFTGLVEFSEAIFLSAVDAYIESGVDYMIIIGDLTNNGDPRAIEVIRKGCDKLWEAGIPTYASLGINDTKGTVYDYIYYSSKVRRARWDTSYFQSYFAKYMAGENLVWDTGNSKSYSVDLPNSNIRLISVDSSDTYDSRSVHSIRDYVRSSGENLHGKVTISDAQMRWIEQRLFEAEFLGKDVIVTSYFPIDGDMAVYYGNTMDTHYILQDRNEELQNLFIRYGVKCVLNGHIQTECSKTYTTKEGSLLEISSASLSTYPIPIKVITYYDDCSLTSESTPLGKIDEQYMPNYGSTDVRERITTDLTAYAKERYIEAVFIDCEKAENGYERDSIDPFGYKIANMFCLYDPESEACAHLIEELDSWLVEVNNMKLYGETDSMEAICKKYGVTLPASEYETVLDFIAGTACTLQTGDFEYEDGGLTQTLYKYTVYTGFYLMAEKDLFGMLHAIDPSIMNCNMKPIVSKLFKHDVLDLTLCDAAISLFSALAPKIKDATGISIHPTDNSKFLLGLATLLPLALPAFGDDYNAETEEIWNIKYKDYIDVASGLIFLGDLVDDVGADSLVSALFSSL